MFLNRFKKFLIHPFKYLYENAYKLGIAAKADTPMKMFWGEELILPLSDTNLVLAYYCGSLGLAEITLTRFFIKHVHAGDIFYDVGANFGYYTALARHLGAEVHAFEPNPSVMRYIRKNAADDVVLNEVAVADKPGELVFYDLFASHKSGMSSLFHDIIPELNRKTERAITVKTITLDDYVLDHPIPTVIKIDVENAESLVLAGARQLLTQHSPIITMELYDVPEALERTRKAYQLITDLGYAPYEITGTGDLRPAHIALGSIGGSDTFVFKKG